MAWGAVQVVPGVNTQKTPSANIAGISQSQLIRTHEKETEVMGGWFAFAPTISIPSTVREIHPWQDVAGVTRIGIGATANLAVMTLSTGVNFTVASYQDITPQTVTSNPAPNFSISSGSNLLTIVDGAANATTFNTVYFNTPVSIGSYLINGAYPINSVTASSVYTILLPSPSTSTVASSGKLPVFNTSSGSASVTVTLSNNNFPAIPGLFQQFIAPTAVGGLTIQGKYQIASIIDSTNFRINATTQASAAATATMNGGNAQIVYYVTLGPLPSGSGFGGGGFGLGGFGTGSASAGVPGTPITATDWTSDNWGGIFLACPTDGPIYAWAPDFGFQNAQVISQAPFFNGGIFVSMPQQILVAWRSTQSSGVQNPLLIRWSNAVDYTNWTVSNQTTAGSFTFSTGSMIVGALQCPQFALVSTDVDVWTMTYVGGTVIFNFTKVGTGCGWVGPHACGTLFGNPYWMGANNFYSLGANGAVPLPCPVWDQVFPAFPATSAGKVRCAVNSQFSEVMWLIPQGQGTECTNYAKVHVDGGEWDYGLLGRTAWAGVSVIPRPIGADNTGQLWLHDLGQTITGTGLPSFRTGWWVIAEGEEIPIIDYIVPDFVYGTPAATTPTQVNITFFGVDFPNDAPTVYGPYTVTPNVGFINVRMRHRMLSALVQSTTTQGFWRLGRIRFRYASSGRR